jgi:hypothetical protein
MPDDPSRLEDIPADQLLAEAETMIAEAKDRIEAYEERTALQSINDGLTTDQRAVEALQRPERFPGEHQVAWAWLFSSPTARLWSKDGGE